ncbi:MAG: alkene reductase [Leptospirales bacterium]|nr:alkene reductase [Leptospirales bacterium]
MSDILFSPFKLGPIELKNRVVMSPMTRSRSIGNVPGDIVAKYYGQRAEAGLIITEGVSPSPNGLGYARIPGIFSDEQVNAWKAVTEAVHAKGGRIFMQMMHTGRIGHPANLPANGEIIGPSAIKAAGNMWTDAQGNQPHPEPRAMTLDDIKSAIAEYANGAKNAIKAGFDGVELHGANGYLIDQFLNPAANQRSDEYGGTPEKRNRFAIEVARAVADAIGKERLGIRISPFGVFNDQVIFPEIEAQYGALAKSLSDIGIAYIHIVDHSSMGAPKPEAATVSAIRSNFKGALILSGGYDRARAEADLEAGKGELVAFGRPFVSNPDLVKRMKSGAELAAPDASTFYTPGEKGYTDYPALA